MGSGNHCCRGTVFTDPSGNTLRLRQCLSWQIDTPGTTNNFHGKLRPLFDGSSCLSPVCSPKLPVPYIRTFL
jgi:hypothetical protein